MAARSVQALLAHAAPRPAAPWAAPYRIDPNRARFHELLAVPGLGPKRAEAVLLERIRGGPFDGPEALQRVDGIGPATAAELAPFWVWAEDSAGGQR